MEARGRAVVLAHHPWPWSKTRRYLDAPVRGSLAARLTPYTSIEDRCGTSRLISVPVLPSKPIGGPRPWAEGGTAAYHITHVENLASIVACGQIECDNDCAEAARNPIGIAHTDLKEQRARTSVTVAAGGTLADYVPFYFAPRSPMLISIHRGYVEQYDGGQDAIVHLVCSVQGLAKLGRFAVINRHPITALAEQFDDLAALADLDWTIMRAKYWSDTDEDGDRKFRRQAEFLVHRSVPIEAIKLVGAATDAVAHRAATLLEGMPDPPPVIVRRDWYY